MINFAAFIAGGLTAATVSVVGVRIEDQKLDTAHYQQLLEQVAQAPPLSAPPPAITPLDALPMEGVQEEPGSARPQIQFKQGVNTIRIIKTNRVVDSTKDPIWLVQLVSNGQVVDQLDSLIGRYDRQKLNRHTAGNKSPLPLGSYKIDRQGIEKGPFPDPELGRGYWIPITPLFATGRSALGFHQDPSWGKKNGESGTSGCIGLQSPEATNRVVDWIRQYNINQITVEA
jgi:lipoprotein-anchoring transpeptidase ErfK/SrfK